MSDFKTVCGINPKDETIINLEKVKEIVLDDEYIENSMCVTIYGADGDTWHFETDLKEYRDVLNCIRFSLNSEVKFSQKALEFNLDVIRLGEIAKLKGGSL